MKKILSAALALVCIWFATPAFANCNLFDPSAVPSAYFAAQGDGTVSNTITDTRTSFRIQTNITANGTNRALFYGDLETPGNYVKTFTIPEGTTSIIIKHNGTTKDIFLWSPNASVLAPGTYTLSFDILSSNPSVVGGLQLKNIQIERGSTATAYTPYNPLCATCDGTVVNYVSATGTVSQSGTPTPDNPIYPTFYKQGNMILRKVGDYADTYDATTGKITRRVGMKVLDGTEDGWAEQGSSGQIFKLFISSNMLSPSSTDERNKFCLMNTYKPSASTTLNTAMSDFSWLQSEGSNAKYLFIKDSRYLHNVEGFKQYLAAQYAAGTPVTVWYPLAEETTEDWPASYCEIPIKIATTKYNESAFSPLNTALANAISVVDSVVSNTITQAASIATLQAQKQTRPNDIADDNEKCPAGKKCLLVEDASGVPHWYEIVTSRLPDGYTELEYIESTGTQWIDTGVSEQTVTNLEIDFETSNSTSTNGFIFVNGTSQLGVRDSRYGLSSPGRYTVTESKNNASVWVVKNENNGTTFTNMSPASTSTLALFNLMNNTGTIGSFYCKYLKIYYFKAYNGNTLVQHLVPAQNSSGVVGMYDTVNGVFYQNKGTGEFIGGQPVFN